MAVVNVGTDRMPLMDYLEQWKEKMHERFSEQFRKEGRGTGLYTLTYSDKRELGGTLRLNGVAVKSMTMGADFKVRVITPRVVSHFDINKRGRAIRFAPFEVMGVEFDEPTITLLPPVEKPS